MIDIDNLKTIFDLSSWLVKKSVEHPSVFTGIFIVLIILSGITIINFYLFIKNWIKGREKLFNSILQARRQTLSHQDKEVSLEYAIEPHKKENSEIIKEAIRELPKFDPLRKSSEQLVTDLQSVNSFAQSEKILNQFLVKYKKI